MRARDLPLPPVSDADSALSVFYVATYIDGNHEPFAVKFPHRPRGDDITAGARQAGVEIFTLVALTKVDMDDENDDADDDFEDPEEAEEIRYERWSAGEDDDDDDTDDSE